MKLFAVRHLPTEWNQKGWLQGERDLPIIEPFDEAVLVAARDLRQRLAGVEFDRVFSSTLTRAHRTGEVLGFEPEIEPLLNEMSFGEFEGRPKRELIEAAGEFWLGDPRMSPIGPEYRDLETRIRSFLKCYRDLGSLLAFSHGSWIRAARSMIESGSIEGMNRFEIPNLSITELEY